MSVIVPRVAASSSGIAVNWIGVPVSMRAQVLGVTPKPALVSNRTENAAPSPMFGMEHGTSLVALPYASGWPIAKFPGQRCSSSPQSGRGRSTTRCRSASSPATAPMPVVPNVAICAQLVTARESAR